MSLASWLNTAWMLSGCLERFRLESACRNLAATQARLLQGILQANRDTEFGRAHRFDAICDPRSYQQSVPLSDPESLAAAVQRIAAGEQRVLTHEPVQLLEPTSGTVSSEKLIPCTAGLRRQFQRGVSAWIADLFWHRPALRQGRAYWSISPALGPPRRSPGGLPIGFSEDAEYLGLIERLFLRRLLVVPGWVSRMSDLTSFRYTTLLALLAAEDLTLISIWNPTFLIALLAPFSEWQDQLCHDLRTGKPPWLRPDPARAERIARICRQGGTSAETWAQLWPRLRLISCWADAAAGVFLPELRRHFPTVEIQPKGLLATEGFVSLPLVNQPAPVLAARCHFFEFQEEDGQTIRLAHELERGGKYRVILTTAGGLYRYPLRDEVAIVGHSHQAPLLRFVGKADRISDLVGEKLAEPHVRQVVERLGPLQRLPVRFVLLVPVPGCPPGYRLYLQILSPLTDEELQSLQQELQAGLEENPYYRHASGVGQLKPVEVALLDPAQEPGWLLYQRHLLARGRKWGDIKPAVLDQGTDWPGVFEPLLLVRPGDSSRSDTRPRPEPAR